MLSSVCVRIVHGILSRMCVGRVSCFAYTPFYRLFRQISFRYVRRVMRRYKQLPKTSYMWDSMNRLSCTPAGRKGSFDSMPMQRVDLCGYYGYISPKYQVSDKRVGHASRTFSCRPPKILERAFARSSDAEQSQRTNLAKGVDARRGVYGRSIITCTRMMTLGI